MKTLLILGLFTATFLQNADCQTQLFHGTWTRLGSNYLFEFDLHLEHGAGNNVEGYFNWKFVQYDEEDAFSVSYYKDKIGATAKEYVRGTWDPTSHTYHLKGYKKDDPDTIIALDEYLLKVDGNGDLGGDTKSHDSWLGRINAKSLVLLDL
ncbi:MAG: hypothetical protein IPM82_26295 [Saprospiraceae bacterium]|nr:hypothetical protein [Saprospiraceae bacterium]